MRSSTAQGDGTLAQVAHHLSDPTQVKKSGDDPVQQSTKGTQHEPDPETQKSVDTLGEIANLHEAQMGRCKRERSVLVNWVASRFRNPNQLARAIRNLPQLPAEPAVGLRHLASQLQE